MKPALLACFLLVLTGCPETQTTPQGGPSGGADAPSGDPAAAGGADENRTQSPGGFDFTNGSVLLEGTVTYDGSATGQVRMDLLQQEGTGAPALVAAEQVPELGPFSLKVPKGYGEIHILGFIDKDSDGPSASDPAGKLTIEIGEVDVAGLELALSDDADLGSLRPGPPPVDGGPPPDAGSGLDGEPAPGEVLPEDEGAPAPDGAAPEGDAPAEEGAADEPAPEGEAPPE